MASEKSAVHFTLQGKGGVGKSLISSLVAQFYMTQGKAVACLDTDPVNQTFVNYKALKAKHLQLMDGSRIDERKFDELMELLLSKPGTYVVDNGASSFVPLSNYLIENNAIAMLQEAGVDVYIHCVLTGGQALVDTLSGFKALAAQTTGKNIVVWLNEYFGPIQASGKDFTEMRVYEENKEKVLGVVKIARRNQDTFGKDVENMVSAKLTFDEVIESEGWSIMSKQRIKTIQKDINAQLIELEI